MVRWRANSLSRRQLIVMLSVLVVTAAVLGVGGAWVAGSYSERAADRVLRSAASAISETLAVQNGQVRVEVPIGAFSFLEDSGRDSVFYSVVQGDRLLTGYSELRIPPDATERGPETAFRYGSIFGEGIRIATQVRVLPRQPLPVVVRVAETLNARRAQTTQMLVGLIVLELMLVLTAALLIRPAVRWGLKPVTELRRQLTRESPTSDIRPLDTTGVPVELHELVVEFNQLLALLGEALSAHRQFTADASHQMRTPLAVLKTHVASLKRLSFDAPEARASIADIEAAGVRLERLLSQLLSLARAEGGQDNASHKRIDLNELVATVCRTAAPEALRAGVDIQFESDAAAHVRCAPLMVEEIISNLVDNAVRYNRPGGSVIVSVVRAEADVFIDVVDNGPGIGATDRAHVFKRFHRLKRDHDKSGSGLGLPVARALATAIGGALTLEDTSLGGGCRFRLSLQAA